MGLQRLVVQIEQRNELRRHADLPLLEVVRELRRMKQQEAEAEFERFEAAHGKAVFEQALQAWRQAEGSPNWRPNSLTGMALQNRVRRILHEQLRSLKAQ